MSAGWGTLPGVDPRWRRTVRVPGAAADAGATRTWHLLDTGPLLAARGATPVGTVLAVHGNPTWSYLWRGLLGASVGDDDDGAAPSWRVVAVDQLEMGFSERTDLRRTLAQRVADLGSLVDAVVPDGPVVTLGHDWGGVVALGWAVGNPDRLAGIATLNTAVHQPSNRPVPWVLRLAGARPVLRRATVTSPAFLRTTLTLARPALPGPVADAYRSPYQRPADREGIGAFVADIPASPTHPSAAELDCIAAGVARLTVPALILWGPRDPVFGDVYLDDLVRRLPHARVHRFEQAGHLVAEDAPYAQAVLGWLESEVAPSGRPASGLSPGRSQARGGPDAEYRPLWDRLDARADDASAAVLEMAPGHGAAPRVVSWRLLARRVRELAAGLHAAGVRPGDRVSLLVRPGATLTAVLYACLRIGAVVVVADAALGVRGLTRAQRGAWPQHVIADTRGLFAARALAWPGQRIAAEPLPPGMRRLLGVRHDVAELASLGARLDAPPEPGPDADAAVLFTSGSTGPAKGVQYTHRRLSALRDALAEHFDVRAESGLVTGFAPFALLGPALGTRSVTPDMDVSAPRTLTARAVADAVRASGATIVFLSPAAVQNVVDTGDSLSPGDRAALAGVRTFLSTGAPIGERLLAAAATLMPDAVAHTPYGMTECLLVTDITLDGVREAAASPDPGVCVGRPVGSARVLISALDGDGVATGRPTAHPGILGEVVIGAPHLKVRYDRLWLTDERADPGGDGTWHRTGDVGHLDDSGRLWIEGRLAHVLTTAGGPLAPVGPEQRIEQVDAVRRAAVVGVGPAGTQQAVAVLETTAPGRRGLGDARLAQAVRAASPVPLAAVLVTGRMPTDVRHNSKVDRTRLAAWAERVLSGGRMGKP